MSPSTAIALMLQASDKPAPDTSALRIVSAVLLVVLVAIIFLRRKGKKKKGDEDDF